MSTDNEVATQKIPKSNITLETSLIDEVKDFIEKKKESDLNYPFRTPTALIREAVRSYIFPSNSEIVTYNKFEELQKRVKAIEMSKSELANEEQRIYIRCVAMLIDLFDKEHDFFDSFKIAKETLAKSDISPIEFRNFTRLDIENYFLDHLENPPDDFKNVVQSDPLFPLLMMFLFLCNLGFTRHQDIIDPMAPMSSQFLETVKKMITNKT